MTSKKKDGGSQAARENSGGAKSQGCAGAAAGSLVLGEVFLFPRRGGAGAP